MEAGLLLLVSVASVGAQLGALHWVGDVLALGVAYYVILSVVLLLVFAARRTWRYAAVAGMVLLVNGGQLVSYPSVQPASAPQSSGHLRVLVYNLYYENRDLAAAVAVVKHSDADIVFLMEYSYAVQQQIESAFTTYPHRLIRPSRYARGLALFSRMPFEAAVHRSAATRIPIFDVTFQVGDQAVRFIGAHPLPPQARWGALHRRQMEAITRIAAQATAPLIVAGDFNAAPWSFSMRRLAQRGQVQPIRSGLVAPSTWRPVQGFGLPLDHVLVSADWEVIAQHIGAAGGSDHVPLIVDLSVR